MPEYNPLFSTLSRIPFSNNSKTEVYQAEVMNIDPVIVIIQEQFQQGIFQEEYMLR